MGDVVSAASVCEKVCSACVERGYAVKWVCASVEKHVDEGIHYHVALELETQLSSRDPLWFDCVFGSKNHGDYAKMKGSTRQAIAYVCKDGDYAAIGIDPEAVKAKKNATGAERCMKMIREGATLIDMVDSVPHFAMTNKRKIEEWQCYFSEEKRLKLREPWLGLETSKFKVHTLVEQSILQWLDDNLFKERAFKQHQLFVWGDAGIGKTHFVNELERFCRIYRVPSEEFYDMYEDCKYDVIVYDEFKAGKTIQFMNEFLQGSPMVLRKKGSQVMKTDNLPVIVLSNYSLRDCYCKADDTKLDTLESRFMSIEVRQRMTFDVVGLQKESPFVPVSPLVARKIPLLISSPSQSSEPASDECCSNETDCEFDQEDITEICSQTRRDMGDEWKKRLLEDPVIEGYDDDTREQLRNEMV